MSLFLCQNYWCHCNPYGLYNHTKVKYIYHLCKGRIFPCFSLSNQNVMPHFHSITPTQKGRSRGDKIPSSSKSVVRPFHDDSAVRYLSAVFFVDAKTAAAVWKAWCWGLIKVECYIISKNYKCYIGCHIISFRNSKFTGAQFMHTLFCITKNWPNRWAFLFWTIKRAIFASQIFNMFSNKY